MPYLFLHSYPGVSFSYESLGLEGLGVDLITRRELLGDALQIDDLILHPVVRRETTLREPSLKRHLPAFKPDTHVVPGLLPLVATTSPAAVSAARTSSDTLALLRGPGGRRQLTQIHLKPSLSR